VTLCIVKKGDPRSTKGEAGETRGMGVRIAIYQRETRPSVMKTCQPTQIYN
jgi:hypothetical protein